MESLIESPCSLGRRKIHKSISHIAFVTVVACHMLKKHQRVELKLKKVYAWHKICDKENSESKYIDIYYWKSIGR